MNFLPPPACHKHPQERVVGVCSACLAQRLTSLVHSHRLPPELARNVSLSLQSNGSPLQNQSGSSQDKHLQTITEEDDPAVCEPGNEGPCFASVDTSHLRDKDENIVSNNGRSVQAPTSVIADTASECPPSDDIPVIFRGHEALSECEKGNSFNERKPVVNQEISVVQPANLEIASGFQGIITAGRSEKSLKNLAECKRSESTGADSLQNVQRISSHREGVDLKPAFKHANDRSVGANKVSLRSLFELDDAERQEIRTLESLLARNARFSGDCMHDAEVIGEDAIEDKERIDEGRNELETPSYQSHDLLCCSCRRALSSSSSSVISSVCPGRIKQSVLFNSLLCRNTRDGKSVIRWGVPAGKRSELHDLKVQNDTENAGIDDRFIRATYIASECRVQSMRRCRSKMEFNAGNSSFSSSEPTSPGPFHVDSRSERKFNMTARVLAIDVPSMFQVPIGGQDESAVSSSEGEQDESAVHSSTGKWTSCQEGPKPGPNIPQFDDLSMNRDELNASNMRSQSPTCNADCKTESEATPPISNMGEEEVAEHESRLLTTPVASEGVALKATISSKSRAMNRSRKADRHENDDAIENELIKVCQRVVERHHRWPRPGCHPAGCTGEAERRRAGAAGDWGAGQTEHQEAGEDEDMECGTGQRVKTEHGEAGKADSGRSGQRGETELVAEQQESREAGAVQELGMEQGAAGEAEQGTEEVEVDYGRLEGSCEAEEAQQQHHYHHHHHHHHHQQQQPQHVIWEPYFKPSKTAVSGSRASFRWTGPSRTVRIAADHPLLRFYLTPLRSSGRARSRHHRSPKQRHFWPLVFV